VAVAVAHQPQEQVAQAEAVQDQLVVLLFLELQIVAAEAVEIPGRILLV
jgi:hypothetical protein